MENITKIYKALSDPNRIRILKILEHGEKCVCKIPDTLGLANSTVSKHLSILRDAGFIQGRKEGKWVHYSLVKKSDNPTVNCQLVHLKGILNDDELVMADRVKCGCAVEYCDIDGVV